jgi:hypothetical protein
MPATLKIGKPVSSKSVKVAPVAKRGSSYQPLFDEMEKLTPKNNCLPVEVPKGVTLQTFSNRISSAMRQSPPKSPAGFWYFKRKLEDGRLGIFLEQTA